MQYTRGKLPPETDSAEAKATDKNCGFYYQMGYNDGFAKGQEQGKKLAADILNTRPGQTIVIQTPTDGTAKELLHSLKRSLRNMDTCRCEPTYSGARPPRKE